MSGIQKAVDSHWKVLEFLKTCGQCRHHPLQCQVTRYTLKTIFYILCIHIFSNLMCLLVWDNSVPFSCLPPKALKQLKSAQSILCRKICKLSFPRCIATQNTDIIFEWFLTCWPPARTNSLKRQLQSRPSSAEVWIMWNSTTHQPSYFPPSLPSSPLQKQRRQRRGASDQMLASLNTEGQRSWVDSGGRGEFVGRRGRNSRWTRPCSTSSAGDKQTAPRSDLVWFELGLPWWRSANWIPPPLINNRWSTFLGGNLLTGNISLIMFTLSDSLFSWHYL